MKRILIALGGLFLILLAVWTVFFREEVFLDPLSTNKVKKDYKSDFLSFGFLPTWMVGKTRIYGEELSHLIFLGIETDKEGNLVWDVQSKKINNEDFLKQKAIIKENGGKNILGIKLFEDEKIKELLGNSEARKRLVGQIKQVIETNEFDGVNLDFEYQKDPLAILDDDFGLLLDELKVSKVGEISVDVFANTVIKGSGDRLKNMIEKIDYLVVMAYDFHRPGVDYTGSVAPIRSNVGERNITEVVENYLGLNLNREKLIMAYPLYGYEWKTYTNEFESKIKRGWYQMASWKRVKELLADTAFATASAVKWDELSMTPWLVFEEEGEIHQIYFENERSLKIKLDLVKQNQFRGYGFWALGYEGEENVFDLRD